MKPDFLSKSIWSEYNRLFLLEHFLGQKTYKSLYSEKEQNLISRVKEKLEGLPPETFKGYEVQNFTGDYQIENIKSDINVQLFPGAAKNWGCSNWNLDYFQSEYGERKVTVYNSAGLYEKGVQDFGLITIREYIDHLKRGSKVYLKFSPMIHHDSEMREAFDIPWLDRFSFPGTFGKKFFLFIGGGKTLTPIHTAQSNTLFIQLYGVKKWTFWKPSDRFFLNVRANRRQYFYSDYDFKKGPDTDFPLSKFAQKFEVTLNPGDVLWFPSFFWHHVENEGDSIGVAYKMANLGSAMRNSRVLTLLSFLSTKPSIIESMLLSRFQHNERVFL